MLPNCFSVEDYQLTLNNLFQANPLFPLYGTLDYTTVKRQGKARQNNGTAFLWTLVKTDKASFLD